MPAQIKRERLNITAGHRCNIRQILTQTKLFADMWIIDFTVRI
jgi:hypothetical protein